MGIGLLIRQERLKQNIKQISLCKGICSPSYLSKIERNETQPSEEVLELLFKRLKLNPSKVLLEDEKGIIDKVHDLYKLALTKRDMETIRGFLIENSSNPIKFTTSSTSTLFTLLMFRLFLIQTDDMNDIRHLAKSLKALDKQLSNKEKFLLHFNLGLFHYEESEYSTSLEYMERALDFFELLTLEEWEIADFYNAFSLVYYLNLDLAKATYYASLSLPIFKDLLLFSRAVDNHIILGNISKSLKDYDKAEKSFIAAQQLAVELNIEPKEAMILHNIGSLKAIMGEPENAIFYYSQSLNKKKVGSEGYFLTVLSIIKECSKDQNHIQVLKWCDEALSLLGKSISNQRLKPFYVHFTLYKALHTFDENLEKVLKKSIDFFIKEKDLRHVRKYSYLLAEFYTCQNRYKAAVNCYEKIKQLSLQEKMIKHWEDL